MSLLTWLWLLITRVADRVCNDCKNISFCSDSHYKYHKIGNKCAPFKVVNQASRKLQLNGWLICYDVMMSQSIKMYYIFEAILLCNYLLWSIPQIPKIKVKEDWSENMLVSWKNCLNSFSWWNITDWKRKMLGGHQGYFTIRSHLKWYSNYSDSLHKK